MFTFIDFFAGIGGFRSGFEKAGMKCVGYCEVDKFARQSYQALYDTEGEWFSADVRTVKGSDLPIADIWTFGFPCQDISIAGKQRGITEGTRSGLFYEIMRLLREKEDDKPKWIIAENVKNLLSIKKGWGFFTILSEMDKAGYDVEWCLYNSKYYGVPQNRERLYIVGHLRGHSGRKILPIPRKNDGIISERRFIDLSTKSVKLTPVARCIKARYNAGITNRSADNSGIIEHMPSIHVVGMIGGRNERARIYHSNGIIGSILSSDYKEPKYIYPCLTPDRLTKRQNGRRFKEHNAPMFTLTTQDRHGVAIKNGTKTGYLIARKVDGIDLAYPKSKTRRARVQYGLTNTVTTSGNLGVLLNEQPIRIRRLTPRECWRLQGFTDQQFDRAKESGVSDSQLYKQAGNAVTVNVTYEIGKSLVQSAT